MRVRALEKGKEEAVVVRGVAIRNADRRRRLTCYEAALRMVVQHSHELGAVVGLAAERLVRDDDR